MPSYDTGPEDHSINMKQMLLRARWAAVGCSGGQRGASGWQGHLAPSRVTATGTHMPCTLDGRAHASHTHPCPEPVGAIADPLSFCTDTSRMSPYLHASAHHIHTHHMCPHITHTEVSS